MINNLFEKLIDEGYNFFTGVPDSLLKYFCICIDNNEDIKDNHIIIKCFFLPLLFLYKIIHSHLMV